jgi:hypothetical protein
LDRQSAPARIQEIIDVLMRNEPND